MFLPMKGREMPFPPPSRGRLGGGWGFVGYVFSIMDPLVNLLWKFSIEEAPAGCLLNFYARGVREAKASPTPHPALSQ